jgi:hypothetical protein
MRKTSRAGHVVFACAAALLIANIGGCALVDQFGGRASDYNFQTGNAKNATILSNILRSAYSLPLEFTDVTTLAGTASAGATLGAAVPVPANHAAAIAAQSVGLTPSATASASNTVNVANLDNQEFYYGLQTPLTMQQVAYYLTMRYGGLSPNELLALLISDIELRSPDGKHTVILYNTADDPVAFNRFYSALNTLIARGLTVEQVTKKVATAVGPELSTAEASDPRLLASIVTAAAGGSSSASSSSGGSGTGSTSGGSNSGLTLVQLKKNGPDNKPLFQFQKGGVGGSGNYRFCFAHVDRAKFSDVNFTIRSQPTTNTLTIPLGKANGRPIPNVTVAIGDTYYCGYASPPPGSTTGKQNAAEGISITTRSLEGIFQYLGEIVRTEFGLGNGQPTSLAIPRSQEEADTGQGFHLFRLYRRAPSLAEPWVLYDGHLYTIAVDPSGQADGSSRVLQLVSDLLALQSSAKALPAPNLIAITTP